MADVGAGLVVAFARGVVRLHVVGQPYQVVVALLSGGDRRPFLDHQAVLNAISRGTREEKEKLVSIASELMEKYSKNIYSHTLDYSFHTELYEMGRNKAVHQVIQGIRDRRFVQRENADGENDSVWLATIPQHFQLAEAIFNSNSAAALAAVDEILEHGFSLLDHSRQK